MLPEWFFSPACLRCFAICGAAETCGERSGLAGGKRLRQEMAPLACGRGREGINAFRDVSESRFLLPRSVFVSYCLEFLLGEVMDLLKSALKELLLVGCNYSILKGKKKTRNKGEDKPKFSISIRRD